MIVTRRFNLLKYWLKGRRNGVGFFELFKKIIAPVSSMKAKPFINKVREEGDYYIVHFKKFVRPLFIPKSFGLASLYQVISEIFKGDDWHYYEIPETEIRKDDIVVDCGAAEGLFSLSIVGRCQRVYAIEPLPEYVWALEKTFENMSNVEIIPVALGAQKGRVFMMNDGIRTEISETETNISVPLETIDELFFKQNKAITYLKADLEGYELEMLAGAKETIKANRPRIAITTYHKAEHAAQIERFLKLIHPDYNIKTKGIEERSGAPVMLHAW